MRSLAFKPRSGTGRLFACYAYFIRFLCRKWCKHKSDLPTSQPSSDSSSGSCDSNSGSGPCSQSQGRPTYLSHKVGIVASCTSVRCLTEANCCGACRSGCDTRRLQHPGRQLLGCMPPTPTSAAAWMILLTRCITCITCITYITCMILSSSHTLRADCSRLGGGLL